MGQTALQVAKTGPNWAPLKGGEIWSVRRPPPLPPSPTRPPQSAAAASRAHQVTAPLPDGGGSGWAGGPAGP